MDYISNKMLHSEMLAYKQKYNEAMKNGEPKPRFNDYIGLCIYEIANRYASKPKFFSYSYKDEMISDGIEDCIKYLHNFDAEKYSNPFAYITQIVHNAFIRRILFEQKQQYFKMKGRQEYNLHQQLADNSILLKDDEVVSSYVSEYERKQQEKKKKTQQNNNKKKGLKKFMNNDDEK